jgi:hypothetical protein
MGLFVVSDELEVLVVGRRESLSNEFCPWDCLKACLVKDIFEMLELEREYLVGDTIKKNILTHC